MKPWILLALLATSTVTAQTSAVDRLVRTLDSLSLSSIDHWKVSPDLGTTPVAGDPTQPGYDDSRWHDLALDASIYPDSCWLRKTFTLPATLLGRPLAGTIRFAVSVDDYGYLWVNGHSYGQFPWDGEFDVSRDVRPGGTVVIVIKAVNTGGPLRLLRARLGVDAIDAMRDSLQNVALSLRVAQKLLSFDTYQTNARRRSDPGTDRSRMATEEKRRLNDLLQSLASAIDVDALGRGNMERFRASLGSVRERLAPVRDFAKRFTLFFDANAHIDAAWLWRERETVEVCKNTFSSVFRMMDERPDFTYTQSSAAYYDWMERLYPAVFAKIKQRIRDGRWEVIGGMWVEPDCNLPSGESWARQLLYAKRYFRTKLGADVTIGWNPDSFGYNWNMPQLYRNAGIDAFITQKIGWNDTNVFPHRVFWWEAPDGSRILSYFPFDYVNTVEKPFQLVDWLRQFEANTGFTSMMILFGVGDHGGGPSLEMLDRIDHLRTLDVYPTIAYGTASDYLSWLRQQDLSDVPVWKDELYLEYHRGTYTTQAAMKAFNRSNETLLLNTERFSAIAARHGKAYPSGALEQAWRNVLFNQFHDILPGSGIREVYIDAKERHEEARTIGMMELGSSLDAIGNTINTSTLGSGEPLVVFNPLSWDRTDVVQHELPAGDMHAYAVVDDKGHEVPSQTVATGPYNRSLLFVASAVPSIGYRCYTLRQQPPSAVTSDLSHTAWQIENRWFRVTVDSSSGWITSILDKRTGRNVVAGDANELQILEDRPSAWDAWNIGLTGTRYPSQFRGAEVVEAGPVRTILRLHRTYLKPGTKKDFPTEDFPSSFFTQDIILNAGLDMVEFRTDVDWWEEKTMLKVAFPVAATDTAATYEIPFGHIARSALRRNSLDSAKFEVPAERWADLSGNDYGVSLLNRSKYGYDVKGNVMRLSLLRSPLWPDPTADRGKHSISYALYPHAGRWQEALTVRRGYEFNTPLLTARTTRHRGSLPLTQSFVRLEPGTMVLAGIKQAEEDDAWIMQMYDAAGSGANAVLTLPAPVRQVTRSDFLESDGEVIATGSQSIHLAVSPNTIVTLKVKF